MKTSNHLVNYIRQYLKIHGERFDIEMAKDAGVSLTKVQLCLAALIAKGEVISCQSTRFVNGNKIEGVRCRLAGYIQPATPGRKST